MKIDFHAKKEHSLNFNFTDEIEKNNMITKYTETKINLLSVLTNLKTNVIWQ